MDKINRHVLVLILHFQYTVLTWCMNTVDARVLKTSSHKDIFLDSENLESLLNFFSLDRLLKYVKYVKYS